MSIGLQGVLEAAKASWRHIVKAKAPMTVTGKPWRTVAAGGTSIVRCRSDM